MKITDAPMTNRYIINLPAILGVFTLYILGGKLGLELASTNSSITAVWAPTAVALAAFLLFGRRMWPVVFVAAFIVNYTTAGTILTSLGISIGNTLEGFVGAYLVKRIADGKNAFSKINNFYRFIIAAVIFSTTIAATIGTLTLCLGGLAEWSDFGSLWTLWWLGDATGALIFTPVFLLWAVNPNARVNIRKLLEFIALVGITLAFGILILQTSLSFSYLILPILIWLIIRFDPREVVSFTALFSVIIIAATSGKISAFSQYTGDEALLFVQSFIAIINLSVLPLSILIFENKRGKWKRDQLTFILESTHNAVNGKNLDGTVNYWNKAAEELYGYTAEEMIGRNILTIIPQDKWEEHKNIMANIEEGIRIYNFETTRIRKDGARIQVMLTNSPIVDDQGNIIGVSTIATDITEQKKLERMMEERRARAEEEMRAEFIANAAHELRTPLTIIKGNVDLSTSPRLRDITRSALQAIDNEVKHLSNLINNMLTISKHKTRVEPAVKERILLYNLVTSVAEKDKDISPDKNTRIRVDGKSDALVLGSREDLENLFDNIIKNAITYNGENVKINISFEDRGEEIAVKVSDNGIGISPEDLPHIFEEFYRSDKSRTDEGGRTGLGLSMVKAIAVAHGGRVEAESTLGSGSTFTVTLPKVK